MGFDGIGMLPVSLCRPLIDDALTKEKPARLAVQIDIKTHQDQEKVLQHVAQLRTSGWQVRVIFLDCSTPVLLSRYSETRRPHPVFNPDLDKNLEDTIEREREYLSLLKDTSDFRIDTSNINIHDLKRSLKAFVDSLAIRNEHTLRVNFMSFGFKHGLPRDCDLLMDVRFLPNPYFIQGMRELTGQDATVSEYVLTQAACNEFMDRYTELLNFLLPHYMHEGKAYLNIGIGCTGGKHRSVAIAEALSTRIQAGDYLISVVHRDEHLWHKKKRT